MNQTREPDGPAPREREETDGSAFPVVGIGASAGGLHALEELLAALPPDTGMAFVIVQHLDPGHGSMLSAILARATKLPVTEAVDGERVEPDHVYVIPPRATLELHDGGLRLTPSADGGSHGAIDAFFRSLASEVGHGALGVVLSGALTDGTLGLREVKARGGITFAQDRTAEHDSMPRSAVAAGCVDYVLPPAGIAREIGRIARHPHLAARRAAPDGAQVGSSLDVSDLKLSQDELLRVDRERNEFLAVLAHELRNPLAPLRNIAEVLAGDADPARLAWARTIMERQIGTMSRMIDGLLDVSRITRGLVSLVVQPVDLCEVVARAAEQMDGPIEQRRQELELRLPPGRIAVEADPMRLEQILVNLLANASKFSADGGPIRVTVEREEEAPAAGPREEAGAGRAVVRVTDEGAGISPELLPHVFELFVQGDRSLPHSQGGLGIGLTMARRLAEMHGGSVSASSEGQGKGATFTLRLPVVPEQSLGAKRRGRARVELAPRRILVVDDNRDGAETLAMLLRSGGHTVEVAHDGKEALERVAGFRPGIVLLDIGLPVLDGYEVARRLRRLGEPGEAGERSAAGVNGVPRDLTLVAVTGYGRDEDRRRAEAAGFDAYFVKPLSIDALLDFIASRAAPAS